MSSSASIVGLSRSRSRYHDQDALLKAFIGMSGCTAKEVAVEALDWKYEQYANSPKRAHDLQLLGYLELLDGRVCRHTGKEAHTYQVTDKGLVHLRAKGLTTSIPKSQPVEQTESVKPNVADRFSTLRGIVT